MPLYRPDFPQFSRRLGQAPLIPVYRELLADGLTPVSAYAKLTAAGGPSFLFESVVGGEKVGRFSFLGAHPYLQFQAIGHDVLIRSETFGGFSTITVRSTCRDCLGFAGEPSVTRPTMPSATPRTCRILQPTIADCPISRSIFTIAWSSSTTSARRSSSSRTRKSASNLWPRTKALAAESMKLSRYWLSRDHFSPPWTSPPMAPRLSLPSRTCLASDTNRS